MFSKRADDPFNMFGNSGKTQTFQNKLTALGLLFESVEAFQAKEKIRLNAELDRMIEGSSDYELTGIELHFIDHYLHMQRMSILLLSYSILESSLVTICDNFARELNLPVSVEDLNGSGIERCKKYLESFDLFCFTANRELKKSWDKLSFLNKLRNCFAHAEGDISKFTKIKASSIEGKKEEGLSLRGSHIIIESGYVTDTIEAIKVFLNLIHKK
ncbi:hypothetical protein Q4519_01480 [Motilimonas sp. 1_MG-2023]|uniref:hypothetical protein n=1 Tax=Motilimonas sp. 1_MG-2023 TaxID=3062672 RepID=UPI0026E39F8A|nr:hypothetical protein [Motilimonas sp. 1_MG-2023]MDO6524342.1 hypothetical protein [Motilimonas sp. 1_MG-2023]